MRMYDAMVGRFYSVDPLTNKYPELTLYQFAGNKPIAAIDLDGLETWLQIQGNQLKRQYKVTNDIQISQQQQQRQLLLQTRTVARTADPCESCTVQRTNIAKQARKIAAYRQIIGPVGGGGANFGRGMISDPVTQATAQGMLTAAMGIPFGASMEAGAFSSARAFGRSLISTNSLKAGLAKVGADATAQMFLNGFNYRDVNLTSAGANFVFKSPLTSSFLGSFGEFSINRGLSNSSQLLGGKKSYYRLGIETGVNSAFNFLGDKAVNKFFSEADELGDFIMNLPTNYTSNLILGVRHNSNLCRFNQTLNRTHSHAFHKGSKTGHALCTLFSPSLTRQLEPFLNNISVG